MPDTDVETPISPEERAHKFPKPLFTKGEALEYASDRMFEHAANLELAKIMRDVVMRKPPGELTDDPKIREMVDWAVDADLQIRAVRDAAQAIRDLAVEERRLAARLAAERP